MKQLFIMAALLLPLTVFANGENENGNGCRNRCGDTETTNNFGDTNNEGGTGIGIGKAEADAHAYASAGASAFGYVKGGDQYQKAYQSLYAQFRNSQTQGQVGIVKNVGPQVEINDNKTITYEQKYQAPSMVAPGIDTSQVNVDCPLYVQDGWSGSLSGPGAGGSLGATDAEAIPTCFALLAANNSTGATQRLAEIAFYCLAFEAAEVDNSECDGWRDVVRGGPAPAVRNPDVREGR